MTKITPEHLVREAVVYICQSTAIRQPIHQRHMEEFQEVTSLGRSMNLGGSRK
jgi:hypothetical protein